MRQLLPIVLFVAFFESSAQGQELPTKPEDPVKTSIAATVVISKMGKPSITDLSTLSDYYVRGNWPKLTEKAGQLLELVQQKCKCVALDDDYVHLFWVGSTPTADEPALFSAVLHRDSPNAYSRVIPGLSGNDEPKLIEVFLSASADAAFASYYISKPLPDPLLEQIPSVMDKFLGPLFGMFDRLSPTVNLWAVPEAPRDPPPPPQILALVSRVKLPESRAGVEVSAKASFPVTETQFDEGILRLKAKFSADGLAAFDAGSAAMRKVLSAGLCAKLASAECKLLLQQTVTTAIHARRGAATSEAGHRELDRVENELRSFVDTLKQTVVAGKATLDNSPKTHLGFGLLSSFAIKTRGTDLRAKVEGGKVVSAPLPRALQMVVLNISPWGYQSKTTRRLRADAMFRPFIGVVYAPDLGVSAGLSVMLLPNLGINVGYAHLFITRPEDGLTFGAVLDEKLKDEAGKDTAVFRYTDGLRRNPLQRGKLGSTFLGVSYNFK